jgi:hypothetical protein
MRPPTAAPHLVSIARSHRLLLAYGRTWTIDLRLWRRRQLPLQLQGNNLTGIETVVSCGFLFSGASPRTQRKTG